MPIHHQALDVVDVFGAKRSSPLTRLNYFDGLFLRAEHLRLDQDGHRNLVFQSNIAGGSGVVHGMDATLDGASVHVGAGLAIDPRGRVLLLVDAVSASIAELLKRPSATARQPSRVSAGRFEVCEPIEEAAPSEVTDAVELYLVTVAHAESACGWEEVRGRACEDACDTTAERPYLMEHALIRLRPLVLRTALMTPTGVTLGRTHLQSRVASAYFADERDLGGGIVTGPGLASGTWCAGATAPSGDDVAIGVLALAGTAPLFLDPWIARRELMETPPRRYWAGRMWMRPWDVFLAQVLQFQCQLAGVLDAGGKGTIGAHDPCQDTTTLLGEAVTLLDVLGSKIEKLSLSDTVVRRTVSALSASGDEIESHAATEVEAPQPLQPLLAGVDVVGALKSVGGIDRIASIRRRFGDIAGRPGGRARRVLVDGGICELPPAGYLPIASTSSTPLERQVADLVGPGVDLRFCAVRADQIPGEFEHGQHLDRINLLQGIGDPSRRELVDIFVPDGRASSQKAAFGMSMAFDGALSSKPIQGFVNYMRSSEDDTQLPLRGAARADATPGGRVSLHIAAAGGASSQRAAASVVRWPIDAIAGTRIRRLDFGDRTPTIRRLRNVAATAAARSAMTRSGLSTRGTTVPAAADDGEPVACWLSLEADANPFEMTSGQSATFRFEMRLLSPVARMRVMTADALGVMTAEPVRNGVEVVVRVAGSGSTELDGERIDAGDFDQRFRLTLEERTLAVAYADGRGGGEVKLAWNPGPPFSASGGLEATSAGMFAGAFAAESDTVDDAGDEHHEAAQLAVTILESAAGGEHFAERALALLFPPPSSAPSGGGIETASDYVLFRRRTREECVTPEKAAPVEERRVVLWHLLASNTRDADATANAVRGGSAEKFEWERIETARFAGRTATLTTSPSVLQSRWAAVGGGSATWFAGYATPTGAIAAEGRDRLRAVLGALSPVTTIRSDANAIDNAGRAPSDQLEPGVDAAAFFISVGTAPKADMCAHVDVIKTGDDIWNKVIDPGASQVPKAGDGRFTESGMVNHFPWGIEFTGITKATASWWGAPDVTAWVKEDWNGDDRVGTATRFVMDALRQLGFVIEPRIIALAFQDDECPIRVFIQPHPIATVEERREFIRPLSPLPPPPVIG